MKEDVLVELPGTVESMVRNAFLVRLDHNGHMLRARISGRMEQKHVRVAVGDRVTGLPDAVDQVQQFASRAAKSAVSQGEGGAGVPLLPALRQDLSRRHFTPL
jgi:translation initiation factor IF-1